MGEQNQKEDYKHLPDPLRTWLPNIAVKKIMVEIFVGSWKNGLQHAKNFSNLVKLK